MSARRKTPGRTDDQLLLMRAAGLLVGQTLEVVAAAVADGVTTLELDRLAEAHIRDHGGRPSFPEVPGYRHTLCTSVNEQIVHGIPGERALRAGDLVSIDCGAIVAGWHGDAAVTVIVGGVEAARPEDLALSRATEDSLYAGIAALRVGERLYAVGEAVEACIEAAAAANGQTYGIVEDYVGHTIGTEMHQDPQIFNYAVRTRGPMVRSGYTGAIEPMITLGSAESDVLADGWTVVTSDGSRAAHWEHTVAVRDEGLWVLTAIDGGAARLAALGAAFAPLSD
ncbi:MAG: type I methionyl aminopeptidase [Actinomycetales bacterium]|uniref:Methionine aminopeptidase n=1 Tax=Candidatus Phosphoribacter hodrii TaxID=2953743 RepID=A0A935IRG5_9MICO|nr:type I methionyl aminopeptidase [Candidatus Phosphoribacter hodrii]MBP8837230.1 type I methionyl aminopeptidase [Dermatophilaceae bacterium]MBK7273711.1 type I methionyl aminopeptidase [Candidatus Phosphoribacter hodrii]MBL0004026.1 type I methionyl aminopeptidase [Candidatus Phosphoribacter hodrii]HNV14576.1 type I methionyl aminopeptidase [Dermatophilaceae bacterium]